jgi:hypothetical protein
MSRKHFERLAIALAFVRPGEGYTGPTTGTEWRVWTASADAVADVCAESNPRFDRDKFLTACRTYRTEIRDGILSRVR